MVLQEFLAENLRSVVLKAHDAKLTSYIFNGTSVCDGVSDAVARKLWQYKQSKEGDCLIPSTVVVISASDVATEQASKKDNECQKRLSSCR